jgi:hypothetical protein
MLASVRASDDSAVGVEYWITFIRPRHGPDSAIGSHCVRMQRALELRHCGFSGLTRKMR